MVIDGCTKGCGKEKAKGGASSEERLKNSARGDRQRKMKREGEGS